MSKQAEFLQRASWTVTGLALLPALLAWLQGVDGRFWAASGYDFFPLLGLVAFTLMWSHYIIGALRLHLGVGKTAIRRYWSVTSWIVLVAIVLHPGILIVNLWRDGFGLPPDSYAAYVASSLQWAVGLGTVSLLIFLSYELHRWFEGRGWWRYLQRASDIGMFLIIIHGFRLGGELAAGWFRLLWFVYAATYVIALFYTYYRGLSARPRSVVG